MTNNATQTLAPRPLEQTPTVPLSVSDDIRQMLENRRDALLRELAGIEKQLAIAPTTRQLRQWWRNAGRGFTCPHCGGALD